MATPRIPQASHFGRKCASPQPRLATNGRAATQPIKQGAVRRVLVRRQLQATPAECASLRSKPRALSNERDTHCNDKRCLLCGVTTDHRGSGMQLPVQVPGGCGGSGDHGGPARPGHDYRRLSRVQSQREPRAHPRRH